MTNLTEQTSRPVADTVMRLWTCCAAREEPLDVKLPSVYVHHGFAEVITDDGSDNEEDLPNASADGRQRNTAFWGFTFCCTNRGRSEPARRRVAGSNRPGHHEGLGRGAAHGRSTVSRSHRC